MTDLMTINFFRNSSIPDKIDFQKVLEFFEDIPNFQIFYAEDYVEIKYRDTEFDFEYRYLITKKSRVSQIYKLNPMFSNVNFLLEMPLLIPTFLAKEIFTLAQKLCKSFELGCYNDLFDDIKAFNIVDLLVFFESQRSAYMAENGTCGKIAYDAEKLNVICKFQRSVDSLIDYYHNEVTVNLCYPVYDEISGDKGICYDWRIGTSVIFPPYVDYINISDVEEGSMFVRKDELFEIIGKKLVEIKNFLPDMYIVKDRQAKACKKDIKKIRKIMINDRDFKILCLSDVIEG